MVELNLQALDTTAFSKDLYVSVRVGEMQKLSKASASRTFRFPKSATGDRRFGKVELFKRIGGSNVSIDPAHLGGDLQEICVPFEEAKSDIKFWVALSGEGKAKVAAVDKPELRNQDKKINEAKEYLEKHSLELRLAEAMQAVLRERPDDPGNFIAHWMMSHVNTVTKIPPPAAPTQGFPVDAIRKQVAKCLTQAGADGTLGKAILQVRGMDSAPERLQRIRSATSNLLLTACADGTLEKALSEVTKGSSEAFMKLPSVGTWISYRRLGAKAVVEPQNQAHNDGTLPGMRATDQNSSGEAFVKMPSVGTWIQHRVHKDTTLEDKAPESSEKEHIDKIRKIASDLLLQASADGTLEQSLASFQKKKKGHLMATSALMGSLAYSCGIKLNYRVV